MYNEKLKDLREESDNNQLELAKILNIDRSQYGHYERSYKTLKYFM